MEWEEEVPKFLEGYEFLESLNVFCSLIEDCKDVVDPAIVLEHQILKSDESNPSVQDLEMLVKDGELRKLTIPRPIPCKNMTSCTGYCLNRDILRVANSQIEEKYPSKETQVDGCFLDCFLNAKNRKALFQEFSKMINDIFQQFRTVSVNKRLLLDNLETVANNWKAAHNQCENHKKLLNEDFLLNCLVRFGILRCDAADISSLVFTTPSMGQFVQFLESGNNAIINQIKRSKYNEISEDKLYCLKLGKSLLPLDYHLRDLSGTGIIKRMSVHNHPNKICKLCNTVSNRAIQKRRTVGRR